MGAKSLAYKDIVERVSKAFIHQSFQPLTLRNLETHLEDLNILNDAQKDFDIPQNQSIVTNIEALGEYFDNIGYETSYLIMNALRFLFRLDDLTDMEFTVPKWLELIRSVVGTFNTSMRYIGTKVA